MFLVAVMLVGMFQVLCFYTCPVALMLVAMFQVFCGCTCPMVIMLIAMFQVFLLLHMCSGYHVSSHDSGRHVC